MSSCLFECLKEAGLERYYTTLQRRGYETAFSLLYLPTAELQDVGISTDSDRQRFLQLVQIIASFHHGGELSPRRVSSPQRVQKTQSSRRRNTSMTNSQSQRLDYQSSSDSSTPSEESPSGYIPPQRRKLNNNIKTSTKSPKRHKMPVPVPVLPTKHIHKPKGRHSAERHGSHNGDNFGEENIVPGPDLNLLSRPSNMYPMQFPSPVEVGQDSGDDVAFATRNIRMSAESLKVQKVMRTKGYNYGLPRDGHTQNGANGLTPRMNRKTPARSSTSGSQSARATSNPLQSRRRITVCVRKRPLLDSEFQTGGFDVITCNREDGGKDGGLVVHELKLTVDMAEYIQQNVFQFDKVFAEHAMNQDIYESAVKPMVDWIMTQTNRATCFGYGQTGAGKTHTLLGDAIERGVFFHAAKDILSRLSTHHGRTNRGKKGFSLAISLYEIYCSRIFDLLNDHKRLQALEDSNKQIHIHGLKSVFVHDMSSLQEVVQQGLSARSVGVTGANQDSSRSHAIVQLSVRDASGAEFSRLSFIDLAGSERACDALKDSDKQNRLEGAEINQSLLALKECIRSLDLELAHTPFRQSKLTQVLRDSFIGNSKTCMIANISPSHASLEHTMNTLRYASRVKELHRKPGYATPRQQRSRPVGSARSAQRRPYTADPVYSNSKPSSSASPKVCSQISRSVSIDSSTKIMDYTAAFTSQGRELARTPPPVLTHGAETSVEILSTETVEVGQGSSSQNTSIAPKSSGSTPARSTGPPTETVSRSLDVRKTKSIFTPEVIAASSTPSKRTEKNETSLPNVLQEISTNNDTRTSNSTPSSTPRFLHDTEPIGGLNVITASGKSNKTKSRNLSQRAGNDFEKFTANEQSNSMTEASGSSRDKSSSSTSSVTAEHGSSAKNISSSRTNSARSATSNNAEISNLGTGDGPAIEPNTSRPSSRRSSVVSNDSDNRLSAAECPGATVIPESTKNPDLPSPKKFLTHLKDKHGMKAKALKQQLRKARRRAKTDSQGSDEESSDHSQSSSSTNTVSTSRNALTSNVQQHHQQLSQQSDLKVTPSLQTDISEQPNLQSDSVIITNAHTPPRLPSPKLDRSQPRRSSRISSRSASPAGTGGRTTPDEKFSTTSSVSNPSTMVGLTSASELRARLAAAVAANSQSDSDDGKNSTGLEKPLPSTSQNKTIPRGSRMSSSSDKENSDSRTKQTATIQRAQSEVIIAHQEHISEILRISIEEERLYHELRDQWGKGTPFESYTKSLRKLLARKTQSIEALKVQLAVYDRFCNSEKK